MSDGIMHTRMRSVGRHVTNLESKSVPPGQGEVITFLSDPASHGCNGSVDHFETHANLVFLAGSDAWKIKRAVRLPYLDFSTLVMQLVPEKSR